jgi:hypothetical protein
MAANVGDNDVPLPDPDYAGLIEALIRAANNRPVPEPPAPRPPPVVPFALVLGKTNEEPLDYNTATGIKFFYRAIKPLEPKFDLKEESLQVFLARVKEQARVLIGMV